MIPNNKILDDLVNKGFDYPRDKHTPLNQAYELGGISLRDTSKSMVYTWYGYTGFSTHNPTKHTIFLKRLYTPPKTVEAVYAWGYILIAPTTLPEVPEELFEITDIQEDAPITELDFTFDQNMNPCIVYVSDGISKMYWYSPVEEEQVTTVWEGIYSPRISLDDKRKSRIPYSDIIFAYMRDNNLYYRLQRERYITEHLIKEYPDYPKKYLWNIGMGKELEFLFYVR